MSARTAVEATAARDEVALEDSTRTTALLCAAAFMTMLDLFIVNVVLEPIGDSYPGTSLSGLSWVLNAYIVVYAACLIPAGSLADRWGRKQAFLAGLGVFTLASLGCAAAPTLGFLIASRVLQAAGAAVLTPSSLGLILSVLPVPRRAGAVKIWATSSAFAGALGPVVGGLLAEVSWRWAFLINLPIGVVVFVLAIRLLPKTAANTTARMRLPDPVGAIAVAVVVGSVSLGLVMADDWGWSSGAILVTAAIAVAAVMLLVHRTRTHPTPVMPPRLFRVPSFSIANATALLFAGAFSALFLSVSLWLETTGGRTPFEAGVAILPGPLAVPVFAALTNRYAGGVPNGFVIALGLGVFAVGSAFLATQGGMHYASDVLPGWIIVGVGIGIANPTLITAATTDLRTADAATGSGVVNTARQAGFALGVAAIVAILGAESAAGGGAAFQRGWAFVTALVLISALTALGIRQRATTAEEG